MFGYQATVFVPKKTEKPVFDIDKLSTSSASIERYTLHRIPKKHAVVNGKRVVVAYRELLEPDPELKKIQKFLVAQLLSAAIVKKLAATPYAHAYVLKRGIRTAAAKHAGAAVLVELDIVDFFGSISPEKLLKQLRGVPGLSAELKIAVANWCFVDNKLPQGAPSSPVLSNIAAAHLDFKVAKALRATGMVYTRYADNIGISHTQYEKKGRCIQSIGLIRRVLKEQGFKLNEAKTKVICAHKRMEICGVVVNKKPTVSRYKRKKTEAALYNYIKNITLGKCGPGQQVCTDGSVVPFDLPKIAGYVSFVKSIHKPHGRRLDALLRIASELSTPGAPQSPETRLFATKIGQLCLPLSTMK